MARPRGTPDASFVYIFRSEDGLYHYFAKSASGRKMKDSDSEDGYPTRALAKRMAHQEHPYARIVLEQ